MCETFKFVEELAGNTSLIQKDGMIGNGPNDARTDEIDASDVVSAVRLIQKTFQKKEDREKALRI